MNIYEACEPIWGVEGLCEKKHVFFFLYRVFWLFLCSQMFICFINITMRSKKGEFVRQVTHIYRYFMNLMNIYEVRVFNGFFGNVAILLWQFNEPDEAAYFIHVH